LGYLMETLELLKQDIEETRDREIEEQRFRLTESEQNRKKLLSLMEDNQAANLALNRNLAFQIHMSGVCNSNAPSLPPGCVVPPISSTLGISATLGNRLVWPIR
jgi:hypothetical protein